MKKLLFLVALLTASFVSADIETIDKDGALRVRCIMGYVFIHDLNNGMIQFMYYDENEKAMKPLKCSQYKS